jgi:DNA-binding LacI/PurR family transcriptional regulator
MSGLRPQPRVTVRQIADRLNISHTTVSRALKDDPRITEAVRKKVQRAAEQMGYQPDPMLAALAHYRRSRVEQPVTSALAWINCWPQPNKLRTFKEFDLYWKGASDEARRSGYGLDEFNCPAELTPARLHQVLRTRSIRGLLLTPGWSGVTPDWQEFDWNEYSVVRFGYSLTWPASHVVTSDQLMDGMLAFNSMWHRGYRRIGMVTWEKAGTQLVRFTAGYLYAQLKLDPKLRLAPCILPEAGSNENQPAFLAWLHQTKPDAILTDIRELQEMLNAAGYRVPKDIGVAALSVLDGDADAGINQNSEEIGAAAVQLLISLIHHNQRGIPETPREVIVAGQWTDGKTLPRKSR